MSDIGIFLTGCTAFIGILWGIGKWIIANVHRNTKVVEANTASVMEFVERHMLGLIDGRDPESYYTFDLNFEEGKSIRIPMIPGV